ncbi:MAG: MATE family efflux transporter [Myxococcales bacterium]|nr:MATE family efflux transporter [Myxococcales bacterium]
MNTLEQREKLRWRLKPFPELARLAWPIAVSMLSFSAMTLSDTLFVSQLGAAQVAGVGLGGVAAFTLICFGFGGLRSVKVLISQAVGAARRDRIPRLVAAGVLSALALGLVALVLGRFLGPLLTNMAATPLQGHTAAQYFWARNLGAPLVLIGVALREVRYGVGDSHSPMRISLLANGANIALDYLFIFPLGMGAVGAAWASVAASALECLALIFVQRGDGFGLRSVRSRDVLDVVQMGWPLGLQMLVEVGSFAILTVLIAGMGEIDGAAHQIALQIIHFSFLPAFATGEAASILVGQAVGANEDALVKRVGRQTLLLVSLYTGTCALVVALFPNWLISGFTDDPELVRVTRSLLYLAAVFQIFDGMHIVGRCVLRGTGDVRLPALVTGSIAWLATPPLTYFLGKQLGWGALGGWVGLSVEIIAGSLFLWWRLERGGWERAAERSRRAMASDVPVAIPAE